jgi:heterodisulfide reductase subunit B
MRALGVELVELPQWNCCGVVASLAEDDLIRHLAPVRNLIRAGEQGADTLITLCSMCYNTLAAANRLVREDEGKRQTINDFMYEEPDYAGGVEVAHLLGFLRDHVGWQRVREQVKVSLNGMKVVPYYGCTLHRPREVGIEPTGSLDAMTGLLEALGASVPYFPAAAQCCGSYQMVANPEAARDAARTILAGAAQAGAQRIALSCPLCEFNLKRAQSDLAKDNCPGADIPITYFSQFMAVCFGEWSPQEL